MQRSDGTTGRTGNIAEMDVVPHCMGPVIRRYADKPEFMTAYADLIPTVPMTIEPIEVKVVTARLHHASIDTATGMDGGSVAHLRL